MTYPKMKQGWLIAILFLIVYIVVSLLFEVLYIHVIYFLSYDNSISLLRYYEEIANSSANTEILLFSQAFQVVGLLIVSLIFYKWINRQSIFQLISEVNWRSSLFTRGCFLGTLFITVLFLILWGISSEGVSFQNFDITSIVTYIGLFFLVSVNEEVFSRGMILASLQHSFSKLTSLIISSIFFACLHLFNDGITYLGFINLILAGLLLGIVYLRTKNLWIAIGLHFTWNLFQGPVYGFEVSGTEVQSIFKINFEQQNIINGGIFGLEGSVITTILMVVVCGYYLWLDRKLYFPSL